MSMGCGSGSILNALVKKSGCSGIGIDRLSRTAVAFENNNMQYLDGDIDDIEKFNLHPTVTLLVDSIYFSRDPEKLIRYLCHIKNNRIYLCYSHYLFENDIADKGILRGDFTNIADILKKIKISYKMIEYSKK